MPLAAAAGLIRWKAAVSLVEGTCVSAARLPSTIEFSIHSAICRNSGRPSSFTPTTARGGSSVHYSCNQPWRLSRPLSRPARATHRGGPPGRAFPVRGELIPDVVGCPRRRNRGPGGNVFVRWIEGGEELTAEWRSENNAPPPGEIVVGDDEMTADEAYRLAVEGTAVVW